MIAAYYGQLRCLRLLLNAGAIVDMVNNVRKIMIKSILTTTVGLYMSDGCVMWGTVLFKSLD